MNRKFIALCSVLLLISLSFFSKNPIHLFFSQYFITPYSIQSTPVPEFALVTKSKNEFYFISQDGKYLLNGTIEPLRHDNKNSDTAKLNDKEYLDYYLKFNNAKNPQLKDEIHKNFKIITSENRLPVFISNDYKYRLKGNMFEKTPEGLSDLYGQLAKEKFAKLENEMIVYPAENEKYVVTVFTNLYCVYCVKLHKEIPEYNKRGITLRFLSSTRIPYQDAKAMEFVWRSKDPKATLDAAINALQNSHNPKESLEKIINTKDIQEKDLIFTKKHQELAIQLGLFGTPAFVFPNGNPKRGYFSPELLLERLK